MSFEEFQDGWHGTHLRYQNWAILAILNLHVTQMPPTNFQFNPIYGSEVDVVSRFSRRPLGYWKGMSLAILNLHVASMPSTKFRLNPTYSSGADNKWRFSRQPPAPCHPCASHQVLAQTDLPFRSRSGLKLFEQNDFSNLNLYVNLMPPIKFQLNPTYGFGDVISRISRYKNETILAILTLNVSPVLATNFQLNPTYHLGADVVWKFLRKPSWISEWNDFSNSESPCCSDVSHQVSAKSNLWFGKRCRLKNSKWPPWQPSWILE